LGAKFCTNFLLVLKNTPSGVQCTQYIEIKFNFKIKSKFLQQIVFTPFFAFFTQNFLNVKSWCQKSKNFGVKKSKYFGVKSWCKNSEENIAAICRCKNGVKVTDHFQEQLNLNQLTL